jgi:hypothetical protein
MSDWDRESIAALRSAVYRGDGSVVEVVRGRLTDDVLQLAGDGLLGAIAQRVPGVVDLAAQCATALRDRCWDGDEELAKELDVALGEGAVPLLRTVPVDLEMLSSFMEGDPLWGPARIDLETGEVWTDQEDGSEEQDEDDDDDRWLCVEHLGSSVGYGDMELFITTVTDPTKVDLLRVAIIGRGAFRRFKDVLSRWPDERESFYLMSADRQRGRARQWLARQGFRPAARATAQH